MQPKNGTDLNRNGNQYFNLGAKKWMGKGRVPGTPRSPDPTPKSTPKLKTTDFTIKLFRDAQREGKFVWAAGHTLKHLLDDIDTLKRALAAKGE